MFIYIRNCFRVLKSYTNPILINKNDLKRPPRSSILNRIISCPEKKFIYIRIPKAANSTITALLWNQLNDMISDPITPTKSIKKSFENVTDLGIKKSLEAKKTYFFFTVVRNPYDRVLSAYLQKLKSPIYQKRYKNAIAKAGDGTLSFNSFCHFLDQGGLYKDPHWIPQFDFMWPSCDRLDFIGRFENLHEDLNHIFSIIFGKNDIDFNVYYGPGRTRANQFRKEYYNDCCYEIISRLYSMDFKAFNYPLILDSKLFNIS